MLTFNPVSVFGLYIYKYNDNNVHWYDNDNYLGWAHVLVVRTQGFKTQFSTPVGRVERQSAWADVEVLSQLPPFLKNIGKTF